MSINCFSIKRSGYHQYGVTLVELIVSIVILSVALTGIMMVITRTTLGSGDPMIRQQAIAIAQSYMEEILTQSLTDPDGAETGGAEAGESRATFDDVWDYHGLADDGVFNQSGNPVAGLASYNIAVSVSNQLLGPVGSSSPAVRISLIVTHDGLASINIPLSAYRLN